MSDSRHKLEEAQYFLELASNNIEDDKIFSFNISAFLAAARSVTHFMQCEFSNAYGFHNWYEYKQNQMRSYNDFKFFNEMRIVTIHQKRVMPNKKISENILEPPILVADSVAVRVIRNGKVVTEHSSHDHKNIQKTPEANHLSIGRFSGPIDSSSDVVNSIKETRNVSRFFKERPEDDLITICRTYIRRLSELVVECEKLFDKVE
jgi:hypothetical protein